MFVAYIDPGSGYVLATGFGYILAIIAAFFGAILFRFKSLFKFFRRRRWAGISLLCSVVVALAAFSYQFLQGGLMKEGQLDVPGRVVVIGIDGMTPGIMEPMMEAGQLPHFARLKADGSYQRLATTNPSQSPVAWTGFATGQNAGKHGLYDFIRRDPATYELSLATSHFEGGAAKSVVEAKRFWQYASDGGVECAIIACPITFPPDRINGRMISGMGVTDILGTEGTFTFFTSEASPLTDDVGGRVVAVPYATSYPRLELYGPRKQGAGGKAEHVTVPMKVTLQPSQGRATIEIQGNPAFELAKGEWSEWQSVTFPLGMFKKMKGILQCYLVETEPDFKLYVSPINYDPRDPFFPISYPFNYAKELVDHVGLYHTQGMPCDTWSLNEERLDEEAFLSRVEKITDVRKKILDLELGRVEKGLIFGYFEALDVTQHMFWRFIDEESPLHEPDSPYANTIADWYQRMDAIVGDVMAQLGPSDLLLVLSDHGFASFRRAVHLNSWLREEGYLVLKDPQATEGEELMLDVDWTKTRAYAIGFGAIYINQKGREGQGIVSPGQEMAALKKELAEKLTAWHDGDDGPAVVMNVYPKEEIFWGPYQEDAPDLFVGFHDGFRASWQTALGASPAVLIEDNAKKWSGDHLIDPSLVPGVLFANEELRENATMYDLAPTILRALGASREVLKEYDFDGEPLW